MATPTAQTLEKALGLFAVILKDGGDSPLSVLAAREALPLSTAHRLVRTLEGQGMVTRVSPGRYVAGPAMLAVARRLNEADLVARISRPALRRLATRLRQTVHLGVLEEGMVTYLVKESRGPAAAFTQEGGQLEAYCSGIGKVLLAHLPVDRYDHYLSEGPFIALTSKTIVDPASLRDHLERVRLRDWALDDSEAFEDLKCVAVPVRRPDGSVMAAISVSAPASQSTPAYQTTCLTALKATAAEIERRLKAPRG